MLHKRLHYQIILLVIIPSKVLSNAAVRTTKAFGLLPD